MVVTSVGADLLFFFLIIHGRGDGDITGTAVAAAAATPDAEDDDDDDVDDDDKRSIVDCFGILGLGVKVAAAPTWMWLEDAAATALAFPNQLM